MVYRPQNNTLPEVTRREHDEKGTGAKKVTLFGYDANADDLARIGVVDNGDGTFSLKTSSGESSVFQSFNDTTTDTNLVYLGKAVAGTATSSAAWQIKRYNKSAGTMTFADDITTFTKTWDSRTSYSY